jgi:hypothetical protein
LESAESGLKIMENRKMVWRMTMKIMEDNGNL